MTIRRFATVGALVLASPLVTAISTAEAAGTAVRIDAISAEQLAQTVESVNRAAFEIGGAKNQGRSPRSFLPRSVRSAGDTTDEQEFVSSELDFVDEMATGMETAADQDVVVDVQVESAESTDEAGIRVVTLHIARTLDNGIVWEEMTPYAVGLVDGPLGVGEIVRVDMEALIEGDVPESLQRRADIPDLGDEQVNGSIDHGPASNPSGTESGSAVRSRERAARAGIGSAGRARAADYAYRYALSPNRSYYLWSNDCTNFISQALKAGGWAHDLGWYRSDGNWWYTGNPGIRASWTWAGAENFYRFARNQSRRTSYAAYVTSLRRGDVLQYKARGATNMTHTMMVTAKVGSMPYLSYHTTNTRNKPFSAISGLNVTWFAHYVS